MNFNKHLALEGQHAFLGASKYHWINYNESKVKEAYSNYIAAQRGTELHAFAAQCIRLGQKLPKSRKTLNLYVNDGIGYKMTPEQMKTGVTPAHVEQLEIYAALFCLEYKIKPSDIDIELRLYQFDDPLIHIPEADDIMTIIDKIISFDKIISKIREQEG